MPSFSLIWNRTSAEINARQEDVLAHVIARCCRLKADVVEHDEREETGLRAVLNYGHTFGHAFESLERLRQAVARRRRCRSACAAPPDWPSDWAASMRNSSSGSKNFSKRSACPRPCRISTAKKSSKPCSTTKKSQHGNLKFVLPDRMGHVESVGEIDAKEIAAALDGASQPKPPLLLREEDLRNSQAADLAAAHVAVILSR